MDKARRGIDTYLILHDLRASRVGFDRLSSGILKTTPVAETEDINVPGNDEYLKFRIGGSKVVHR